MTLRILHVVDSLNPVKGGPPATVRSLTAAQNAVGLTAEVVTNDPPPIGYSPPLDSLYVLSRPTRWDWIIGRSIPGLANLVRAADVVHVHGVWDPLILGAVAVAQRIGVPYVMTPHGMLHPWSLSQKRCKKRLALALWVGRRLVQADAVHALTQAEVDYVSLLGVNPQICRIIPNGIDGSAVDEYLSAAGPHPLSPDTNCPYILFLSRLHYKKGLDLLAEAFVTVAARHPTIQLVVAGADDGAEAGFVTSVARLGLTNRVHVVGPLYDAAKWGALAHAVCFCLPSRQEGFSMAILEALACRLPTVITDACCFPDLGKARAGIVVPVSAPALASALNQVLDDQVAARQMGAVGRRLIDRDYTWNRAAGLCQQMYAAIHSRRITQGGVS